MVLLDDFVTDFQVLHDELCSEEVLIVKDSYDGVLSRYFSILNYTGRLIIKVICSRLYSEIEI